MTTAPKPWVRRDYAEGCVQFWFPFDEALIEDLKQAIPYPHRQFVRSGGSLFWEVRGEPHMTRAEQWFHEHCGRGKEIAKGQMEMAL